MSDIEYTTAAKRLMGKCNRMQCDNISGCNGLMVHNVGASRNRYISFVRHAALLFQQWRLQKLQEQKETEGNEVRTWDA